MDIVKSDIRLLLAFIQREAEDFRWQHPFNKIIYMARMLRKIKSNLKEIPHAGGNYLILESCTNLGCKIRELQLSFDNLDHNWSVQTILPPSPNGGVSCRVIDNFAEK